MHLICLFFLLTYFIGFDLLKGYVGIDLRGDKRHLDYPYSCWSY